MLLLFAIVICTCYGESTWDNQSEAKAEESIVVEWQAPEQIEGEPSSITGWKLFRQTELGSETEVASGSAAVRELRTVMPTGTIGGKIRLVIRPLIGNDLGPAGAELLVKRIK